jgi:hypothetical protein
MAGKGGSDHRRGGRKKGTANKLTQDLRARLIEAGFDPADGLLELAQDKEDKHLRFQALKELMQYVYPKRKTMEHTDHTGHAPPRFIIDIGSPPEDQK